MRLHYKEKRIILLILDLAAMLAAFSTALALGHWLRVSIDALWSFDGKVVVLFVSVVVLFFILDLYSLYKLPESFAHQLLIIALGLILSAILVTFLFFLFRHIMPRSLFILFYLASFMLISTFRYLFNRLTLRFIYWKILIVGDKNASRELAEIIAYRQYLHARVVGYLSEDAGTGASGDLSYLGMPYSLVSIVEREEVDQVIVDVPEVDDALMELLLECMRKKVGVLDYEKMLEDLSGKVRIDRLSARWFIRELGTVNKRYFWYAKRSFDVVVALSGLCAAAPLLPLVALLIKLDSKGSVFYGQQRTGRGNREFRVWKLRSMVADADKSNVYWTTDNDERITRAGKLLRKLRFDEVPQLLNILKGEMSLIGPRPEAVSLVEKYAKEIPYYRERHLLTPGLTGWAQINYGYGNSIEDTRQKLMFDFYYVKNRSIALDLMIILRTIRTVLTGKGAM